MMNLKIYLIACLLILLTDVSSKPVDRYKRRELRGGRGGGGGGRSSGGYSRSSGYSKSGSYTSGRSTYKVSNGVYKYSTVRNDPVRTNKYWDPSTKRTTEPFYVYYLPANYYNAAGYYSSTFSKTYYDGYGYNFYYGTYGYYDYSVNPEP